MNRTVDVDRDAPAGILGGAECRRRADLVLRGGRVWAGKGLPPATALAARDGRVVAVGGDADVAGWIGGSTKVVELAGRLAVPGFNDAHVHFLSGGFGLLSVDLRGARDEADLARLLGGHARHAAARDVDPGRQLGPRGLALAGPCPRARPSTPRRRITRCSCSGSTGTWRSRIPSPCGWPASPARRPIRRAGPSSAMPPARRRACSKDNAADLVARVIPEPSREMNLRAARAALAEAARVGVTTIQDNSSVDALPTYQELRARGELTARMHVWRYASAMPSLIAGGDPLRPG